MLLTLPRGDRDAAGTGHPGTDDDAGTTLIEVMVAMTISVILGAMALAFFVGTFTSAARTTDSTIITAQSRQLLDAWTGLIRVAAPPAGGGATLSLSADHSQLIFLANVANRGNATTDPLQTLCPPRKVVLSLSNGQLVEQDYVPTSCGALPLTPTSTDYLLGCAPGNANSCSMPGTLSSAALFTPYYQPSGCPANNLSASGLCTIDPAYPNDDPVAVQISFVVTPLSGQSPQQFTALAALNGSSS